MKTKNRNLVIMGSHPDTRSWVDFDRTDCDIWLFNEAMKEPWAKRADAVFQLHQPVIWRSAVNRNDPHHYDWLKGGNTPTIYMIEQYQDVPKAEKYPLEEVKEMLANSNIEQHFTSSPAFAIALAVYLEYERIEIYGIEMETNTEYAAQRDGIAFWVGFALGRGVHVEFHSAKGFFKQPLYGYDGDCTIPKEYFAERIAFLKPRVKEFDDAFGIAAKPINEILDRFQADYKASTEGLENAILQAAQAALDFGTQDGALQTQQRYLAKCEKMIKETGTYVLGRQEYEGGAIGAAKQLRDAQERYNIVGLQLEQTVPQVLNANNKNRRARLIEDLKKLLAAYFKVSTEIGICNGVGSENTMNQQKHDAVVRAAGGEKSYQVMMDEMAAAK